MPSSFVSSFPFFSFFFFFLFPYFDCFKFSPKSNVNKSNKQTQKNRVARGSLFQWQTVEGKLKSSVSPHLVSSPLRVLSCSHKTQIPCYWLPKGSTLNCLLYADDLVFTMGKWIHAYIHSLY